MPQPPTSLTQVYCCVVVMPPSSIEDAFNDFERTLDEQIKGIKAMDISDLPPSSPDRRRGGFILASPTPSSPESDVDGCEGTQSPSPSPFASADATTSEFPSGAAAAIAMPTRFPILADTTVLHPGDHDGVLSAAASSALLPVDGRGYKLNYCGFSYTLKYDNKKSITYNCMYKRKGKHHHCDGIVKFPKDPLTKEINYALPNFCETLHTRTCCVVNNIKDMATYQWAGRESDDGGVMLMAGVVDCPVTKTNVAADMARITDDVATQNLTIHPKKIWERVKSEMDDTHPYGWTGLLENQVAKRVRKARTANGLGAISTVTNIPEYRLMKDTDRPFLQQYGCFPHPQDPMMTMQMMIYGNPTLIQMLKRKGLDIYVDATFDCTPDPFYQTLILVVFHEEMDSHVPVLYVLISHKHVMLYYHVFHMFVVCSDLKMQVNTYTSDFEIALFSEMGHQFGPRRGETEGGAHVGCLFHLKQAWRKYLVVQCKFSSDEIAEAMAIRGLDTLTIIPRDEIVTYGIPFLRSVLENDDESSTAQWDVFWHYFAKQWLNKIPS